MGSNYYTGTGSRETPLGERQLMTEIAMHMAGYGYTLRTGVGSVADKAFELGAGYNKVTYVPFHGPNETNGISCANTISMEKAAEIWKERDRRDLLNVDSYAVGLGAWSTLPPHVRGNLAKCTAMVLGLYTNRPSEALFCWTPRGEMSGSIAHSIATAVINHIPVFNLADTETEEYIRNMLAKNIEPSEIIENRRRRCEREREIYGII